MTTYAIGIDPSLTGCAIAWLGARDIVTHSDGDDRLVDIHKAGTTRVQRLGVNDWFVAAEDLPAHARGAGLTGMAHGVVRLALTQTGTPYILIPPATLKKYATGKGNATKADMRMAMFKRAGIDERDDNKVDAWWLQQIAAYACGDSCHIPMPKAQRECLFKLAWPEDITARMLEPYEQVEVG